MDDLSGKSIKGYELHERIGKGGMGAVYRAFQPIVNREVAIKVILPEYANRPDFIRRFEAEAHLVARLEHPFIVPLFDYWRDPDGAFLVVRWMKGGSLADAIRQQPLSPEKAAQLLDQIAAALTIAHRHSVIHRDLKPDNILLDEDGNAYLADFGIAKDLLNLDGEQSAVVVGTPQYMAPEQLRGETVTPQTDIYSLGHIVFTALTGQNAFAQATPAELLYKHLHEPLPTLRTSRPELPAALDKVLAQATAKTPNERFPDTLSFARAFRAALPAIVEEHATLADTTHIERPSVGEITTPLPKVVTPPALINPYKGLRAFQEADADDFFGREALVEQLIERLREPESIGRFLAVVGPSGSGKSSVVKAGLIPALRQDALSGSANWFVVEMFPGAHPFEELEAALLRIAVNPPASLLEQLTSDERGLARALKRTLPGDENSQLLLIIDQFEEVFTLVEEEAVRTQFISALLAAIDEPRSRLRVVITLRADFYDRPLLYEDLGLLIRKRTEVVLPLTSAELEQAMLKPAEKAGLQFEPGLVNAMVQDVGQQPGTLPLLQYALTELFERRKGHSLTLDAYRASGGVLGALARRADELYLELDVETQAAARQLFLRLVTLGEGTEDTRRRVRRAELASADASPMLGGGHPDLSSPMFGGGREGAIDRVIDLYGKYRLLTFDRDPVTRGPTVEVAHEALIRTWTRLREWITDNRDDLRIHRRLTAAANEWADSGQDASYLASGLRLAEFEEWAKETDLALNVQEKTFIDASVLDHSARQRRDEERKAHEQRLQRRAINRLRYLAAVLGMFLAFSGWLIKFATDRSYEAQREAQRANEQVEEANRQRDAAATAQVIAQNNEARSESLRLASEARNILDNPRGNAELAALLSSRAVNSLRSPEAVTQLAQANQRLLTHQILIGHTSGVESVAFSPDGRYVLTCSNDNTARLWDVATGAAVHTFSGHTYEVGSVDFSPDGRYALTGSLDGTARLWDVATGAEVHTFSGHTGSVVSVDFSPDGRYALTGGFDNTARLWDVATGAAVHILSGHTGEVGRVAFSPDGRYALTGSNDNTARLWDVATGAAVHTFSGHTDDVWSVTFSPDGRYALTGSFDNTARLWDVATGAAVHTFSGHTDNVVSIAFSPDGRYALTGSFDSTARLWDVATGAAVHTLSGHTGEVGSVAFSPDGRYALTGSGDNTARLWKIATGAEVHTFRGHTRAVGSVAFSPDGRYALTGSYDRTARLWDVATGAEVHTLSGHTDSVISAAFSPDNHYALTGSLDDTARLWDVATGAEVHTFSGHTNNVVSVAFSPDNRYALTGSLDDTARLWDVATGAEVHIFSGHTHDVVSVAFSPDSRYALTGSLDNTARLWDVATGVALHIFGGHTNNVVSVAFSPDSRYALTGSLDDTARLWDVATGVAVHTFSGHTHDVVSVAFSPDGRYVLTGSWDSTARLWDVATGAAVHTFSGHTGSVYSVAFSPDGRYALTGSWDSTARLWDVATGAEVHTFSGHTNNVVSVAFSPDGRYTLTGGLDRTARLWDVATGAAVHTLSGHTYRVVSVAFSPDGRYALTGSHDRTARLWQVIPYDTVEYACAHVFRDFTAEERTRYSIDDTPTCPQFAQ